MSLANAIVLPIAQPIDFALNEPRFSAAMVADGSHLLTEAGDTLTTEGGNALATE